MLGSTAESNEVERLPVLHELVAHFWGDDKLKMTINQRKRNSDHSRNEEPWRPGAVEEFYLQPLPRGRKGWGNRGSSTGQENRLGCSVELVE